VVNEHDLRKAREIAGQLWCLPTTSKFAMIPELAEAFAQKIAVYRDQLEMAWVVIANVGVHKDGWNGQHEDWVKTAEKWRDDYHKAVPGVDEPSTPEAGEPGA